MKTLIVAIAAAVGLTCAAQADLLLDWDFSGNTGSVASQVADNADANLASGVGYNTIERGGGALASSANSSFRTTGFQNDGISVANTDYFELILSAASGFTLSLDSIDARFNGTGTFTTSSGIGVDHQWAYSLDGSTFTLIGSAQHIGTTAAAGIADSFDLSAVSALQDVAGDVYLRYYATGATSTGGWGLFNQSGNAPGLAINGSLAVVPEPSVLALLAIGGLAVARTIRRRKED